MRRSCSVLALLLSAGCVASACARQETGDHTCAAHDGKGWQTTPCPAAEFHQLTGWRHASATGGALVWARGQAVCVAPIRCWSAPEAQHCFDLPTRTP